MAHSIDRGLFLSGLYVLLSPLLYFFFLREGKRKKDFLIFSALGLGLAFLSLGALLGWKYAEFFQYVFVVCPSYKALSEKIPFQFYSWKFVWPFVLVSGYLFWLTWDGLRTRSSGSEKKWAVVFLRNHLLEIALTVLSVFYSANVLLRADQEHLIYGMIMAYLLLIFSIQNTAESIQAHSWVPEKMKNTIIVLIVCGISFFCLAKDFRGDVIRNNFPIGVSDDDFISPADQKTIMCLRENMKPTDDFFTMTSEASWYYFINKPCPTRFPYLWTAAPRVFQEEISQVLAQKKVKWVLYKDQDWSYQIDGISNEEKFPVVSRFIKENYRLFKNIDGNELWVLKNS
jgi:hypothetical protein